MNIKNIVQKSFNFFGLTVLKHPSLFHRNLNQLLNTNNINLILDIGAHTGLYGLDLIKNGYKYEIISYEPVQESYIQLVKTAKKYSHKWQTKKLALGKTEGEAEINIAANYQSSSLLDMMDSHLQAAPHTGYFASEKIKVSTLDLEFNNKDLTNKNIFVKMDIQGLEYDVLMGGKDFIQKVKGLQLEMSLTELYKGEKLFFEISNYLLSLGFQLQYLEPGLSDTQSGRLLQTDAIFFRN